MNIQELASSLNFMSNSGVAIVVYFILKNDERVIIRRVDITNNDLEDLKKRYLDSIGNFVDDINNGNLKILNLSMADERKEVIYQYDLEEVPQELSVLMEIHKNEIEENFSSAMDDLRTLYAYVISIGTPENNILLYRKHHTVSAFSAQRQFFIFESDHRFVRQTKDMLRLDCGFDIIYANEEIFVKNLRLLETFLGFHDIIKREAESGILAIDAVNILSNPEKLTDDVIENVSFARKLVKATTKSLVLEKLKNGDIQLQDVIDFTRNHKTLTNKFKYIADGSKIELSTKESKKLFLKLLSDDYLHSELTKSNYDSLAKDAL